MPLLFACACSEGGPNGNDGRVPVELSVMDLAVAVDAQTKAPLNAWNNTPISMAYGNNADLTTYAKAWHGTVNRNVTSFSPLLFYPNDNSVIYLRGFYPRCAGTETSITGNLVSYTGLTGSEDVMISNKVSGQQSNTIKNQGEPGIVKYSHLLTQLSFRFRNDGTFPTSMKVAGVRVNGVRRDATLNLNDGSLTFSGVAGSILTTSDFGTPYEVTTVRSTPKGIVMVEPGVPVTVDILFNSGDEITVSDLTIASGGAVGKAYEVDLTFKGTSIMASDIKAVLWQTVTVNQIPGTVW